MHSKTRVLNPDQLLDHLPALQQLLYRLICCQVALHSPDSSFLSSLHICISIVRTMFCSQKDLPATTILSNMPWPWYTYDSSLMLDFGICSEWVELLSMQVLKESFKIYCSINDGIINLVDLVWSFMNVCTWIIVSESAGICFSFCSFSTCPGMMQFGLLTLTKGQESRSISSLLVGLY